MTTDSAASDIARTSAPRLCILVAGQDQAASETIARTLGLMGAVLLCDDQKGEGAAKPIVTIFERFFNAVGANPDAPVIISPACFKGQAAQICRQELAVLLDDHFGSSRLFVISSSHLDGAFPLWLAALESMQVTPRLVIPVTHPQEWNSRHNRRRRLEPTENTALAQWLVAMLAVERESRNVQRIFANYDAFIAAPGQAAQDLSEKLACLPKRQAVDASSQIDRLWQDEQAAYGLPRPSSDELPEWIGAVYDWFREAARKDAEPDPEILEHVFQELTRATDVFAPWLGYKGQVERQLTQLQQAQNTRERETSRLRDEMIQSRLDKENLQQEIMAISERAIRLESERDSLRREIERASEERGRLAAAQTSLQGETERHLAELTREMAQAKAVQESALAALASILSSQHWKLPLRQRLGGLARALAQGCFRQRLREDRDICLIARSGHFDASYYLKRYSDLVGKGIDPYAHYVRHGAREGRWPHPRFDSRYYLCAYPDVAAAGMNPLAHFIRFGSAESRRTHAGDNSDSPYKWGIDHLLASRLFGDTLEQTSSSFQVVRKNPKEVFGHP